MKRALVPLAMLATVVLSAGCRGPEPPPPTPQFSVNRPDPFGITETTAAQSSRSGSVEVPLLAKSGSNLSGTASFTEVSDGVRVVIDVAGISPGKHGTHVHEKGDCSSPDAKSAGEHFSPDGHPHALPPKQPRHIGDFGNIDVGDDGRGRLELIAPGANLREGDRHSFLGRAIIVHANPDDGSQPSGNAGERIGCAEIRA